MHACHGLTHGCLAPTEHGGGLNAQKLPRYEFSPPQVQHQQAGRTGTGLLHAATDLNARTHGELARAHPPLLAWHP
jgi:hypothetical protein